MRLQNKNSFEKSIVSEKKTLNSSVGKMLVMEGLEYAPKLYERETKRIKNKRICSALASDLANYAVDQAIGLVCRRFLK